MCAFSVSKLGREGGRLVFIANSLPTRGCFKTKQQTMHIYCTDPRPPPPPPPARFWQSTEKWHSSLDSTWKRRHRICQRYDGHCWKYFHPAEVRHMIRRRLRRGGATEGVKLSSVQTFMGFFFCILHDTNAHKAACLKAFPFILFWSRWVFFPLHFLKMLLSVDTQPWFRIRGVYL